MQEENADSKSDSTSRTISPDVIDSDIELEDDEDNHGFQPCATELAIILYYYYLNSLPSSYSVCHLIS